MKQDVMEEIKSIIIKLEQTLETMEGREEETRRAYIDSMRMSQLGRSQRYDKTLETKVKWWVSNYLGAHISMIASNVKGESRYNIMLRWHALPSVVLSGSLVSVWPSWLNISLQTHLSVQNLISEDTKSVEACRRNDVQSMRKFLSSGEAHPNDTTENHTLLRVCVFIHQSHSRSKTHVSLAGDFERSV
jgi:hypothetical protein